MDNLEQICEKWTLANISKYGKADVGSVMGKIMQTHKELRSNVKVVKEVVQSKVSQLNSFSKEELDNLINEKYPDLIEEIKPTKEKQKKELPTLPNAKMGMVVTRLPPEPSGFLHIGHAYSGFINWYYARKYEGKVILRFEDTNPTKAKLEFYDHIRNAYKDLEIDWDEEIIESERIGLYYEYAEKLIKKGKIYACSCDQELIKSSRHDKKECVHRNRPIEENLEIWNQIIKDKEFKEGDVIFRLRGDLESKKAALRDPSVFRIIDAEHPLQGKKYRLWPLYDFAVSLEDSLLGVTHVLRSEEFIQKIPLQNYIKELLGFKIPEYVHYSRLKIKGTPVQKRKIRELIQQNYVEGWDDIRLSTVKALLRRGILPETISDIAYKLRLSKSQGAMSWLNILAENRKQVDKKARRMFAVVNPIKLTITNPIPSKLTLDFHPDIKEFGKRKMSINNTFFLSEDDVFNSDNNFKLEIGSIIRLKDYQNVKITRISKKEIEGEILLKDASRNYPKLQWVNHEAIPIIIREPSIEGVILENGEPNPNSLLISKGLVESSILTLKNKPDTWHLQLERLAFGRIDEFKDDSKKTVIFNKT